MTLEQVRQLAQDTLITNSGRNSDVIPEVIEALECYSNGLWSAQEAIDTIEVAIAKNASEPITDDEGIDFEVLEIDAQSIFDGKKRASGKYQDIIRKYEKDEIGRCDCYNEILENLIEEQGGIWSQYCEYVKSTRNFVK